MEPKANVLTIDPPNELRFTGPFNKPVVTIMKLTNPIEHSVMFKIKTTAPKRYCVRPNFGYVHPNSHTKVEICLQPFAYDPNEKNKHKFMVQSLVLPDDCDAADNLVILEKWKQMDPDQFMDAKLKCVFEMPAVAASKESSIFSTNEASKTESAPKALTEEKISNLPLSENSDMIVSELRQVREENSDLRKENLNLKEQVIRLKSNLVKPPVYEPFAPMAEKQIPMFYIAMAILAAIVGLLLGKYLL